MPNKLITTVLVAATYVTPAAAHLTGSEGHNAEHGLTLGFVAVTVLAVLAIGAAASRIVRRTQP